MSEEIKKDNKAMPPSPPFGRALNPFAPRTPPQTNQQQPFQTHPLEVATPASKTPFLHQKKPFLKQPHLKQPLQKTHKKPLPHQKPKAHKAPFQSPPSIKQNQEKAPENEEISKKSQTPDKEKTTPEKLEKTELSENAGVYSALIKRPSKKILQEQDASTSYVAGIKLVDELAQRKQQFNGWKKDDNALLVVRMIEQGEYNKFIGADLQNVDFSGATLSSINLQNADLKNANLAGVDLRGADLRGVDLRGANLEEADLEGANLEGALLDGAYLKNTKIIAAKLSKKALNELQKIQQLQQEAEEGKLDLRKVNLKYLDLRRLDLRGVDLTGVDLSGVNLVGVNLSGVKIDAMYLDGTYAFKQAQGRKVNIKKGNFAGLDLTSANQIKAQLTEIEALRQKRLSNEKEAENLEELQRLSELQQSQKIEQEQQTQQNQQDQETSSLNPSSKEEEGLSAELRLLKSRRQNQATPEELLNQLSDVVLEKKTELKSGARSLVTKRPRRKEELPPSPYDFPILYPVDEEEKQTSDALKEQENKNQQAQQALKEKEKEQESKNQQAKQAQEKTNLTQNVKKVINKMIPQRRVKKQRQRQRS